MLKKFMTIILVFAILAGSCIAEELSQLWHISFSETEPPQTVCYPEFQFNIPENWLANHISPEGRSGFEIADEKNFGGHLPTVYVEYVPYAEMEYGVDKFDANTYVPGSYEFRASFENVMYYYGGNQIDYLGSIRAGDRYGFVACFSQDGEGINTYSMRGLYCQAMRVCWFLVPGEDGCLCVRAFIGGKEEEFKGKLKELWLSIAENLTFNGGSIEFVEESYPPYILRYFSDYTPNAPQGIRLIASYDSENRSAYEGLVDEVSWKYEADGCNVELGLLLADGLANENVEFAADAETGVTVTINGKQQKNRPLKGLENGNVEYVTLEDGTEVMIYSAVYETSARTFYFEGALFVYEDGVAMPFISSNQPIPDGVLTTAIGLYVD